MIIDCPMPGFDRADTLSRIRARPNGEAARAVVWSASVGETERWRLRVLGADDVLDERNGLQQRVKAIAAVVDRAGWRADTPQK